MPDNIARKEKTLAGKNRGNPHITSTLRWGWGRG